MKEIKEKEQDFNCTIDEAYYTKVLKNISLVVKVMKEKNYFNFCAFFQAANFRRKQRNKP